MAVAGAGEVIGAIQGPLAPDPAMLFQAMALGAPASFALTGIVAFLAPDLVRQRNVLFRRLAAAAAAGIAFTAHTQSSGHFVADAVWGPALAGGFTLLAGRAQPRTVAMCAVAAGVLSVPSPQPLFAFMALGAGLAMALAVRRTPLLSAVTAGLLVNAALRLRLPGPPVTEVAAAVALLSPVAVSGYRGLRRRTRPRFRAAAAAGVAAVAGFGLLGALAVAAARPGLEQALDHAGRGLRAARTGDQQQAAEELEAARTGFAGARRSVGAPWARPAFVLPVLGPHLQVLEAVGSTGARLAVSGEGVAKAADLSAVKVSAGRLPIEQIQALEAPLRRATDDVAASVRRLRRMRSPWLVPPVASRLDANVVRLAEAEQSLRTSQEVVAVLPRLLGADRPRRWFLAVQTPSEARGAGGIIGNFGEISADRGQLALVRFGRSRELNTQGVDPASRVLTGPPDYVARYQRFDVTRVWQNVSLSPDFPSVTRVIAGLYPQSGGQAVDGAIAIDPVAMAALLRLIGPITVSSWPEPITAENAERILLYEQYVRFPLDERVDFLAETTQQLWERLSSADLGGARRIVDTLGAAVAGKHLLISAVDPTEDAALGRAEVNGGFRPIRSDSLAVVTQNGGGNKIDWFLRRSLDYRPQVDPGSGELTARLTVTLENRAPPGGLPDYLIGTGLIPPHPTGTNRLYLSVYTPWGLSAARIDGIPRALESETELGRRVYSTWVNVAPQGKAVVELDLRGRLAAPGEYELDLHAQPMVNPDQVTVGLDGRRVRRLVLEGDRTVRWARPATGQGWSPPGTAGH